MEDKIVLIEGCRTPFLKSGTQYMDLMAYEIGQLAIVAILLPLLLALRSVKVYAKAIMPIASSIIAVVALNWTLQRW